MSTDQAPQAQAPQAQAPQAQAPQALTPPTVSLGAAARRADEPWLLVLEERSSRRIPLPRDGVMRIGRAPDNEVQLADGATSRRHARLVMAGGCARIEDLGSHNGTSVNGRRVDGSLDLLPSDLIVICDTVLVVHGVTPSQAPSGLLTLSALRHRLQEELDRARRYERQVCLLMVRLPSGIDVDAASGVLLRELRPFDHLASDGGGDLLILLPEASNEASLALAERCLSVLRAQGGSPEEPRAGLARYPQDGCDPDSLLAAARTAGERATPGQVTDVSQMEHDILLGTRRITVADPTMLRIFDLLRRLAGAALPVLIHGETGVGKESAAYAIHHFSKRIPDRYIAINCAAIPASLAESELFGHERGAFSGATATKVGLIEAADGGTLFLDEIGELPLALQAKLLRALEQGRVMRVGGTTERPVDVRVVSATNRDLEEEIRAGRFRQDLYFRLAAAKVVLPPLRERPRELLILARRFLQLALGEGRTLVMSAGTAHALATYQWPGNVRELRNVMEYLAATVQEGIIDPWHLPTPIAGVEAPGQPGPQQVGSSETEAPQSLLSVPHHFRPIEEELRELERRRMIEALEAATGNQTRAAELISMPLRTFVLRLKQYDIPARTKPKGR